MAGPTGRSVVHVHPSLRCNLKCRHCYSDSSPTNATELDFDALAAGLEQAYALGYRSVAVSGGEPFVYPKLAALVARAHSLGYSISVATNGHFLKPTDLRKVRDHVGALAVSLDGLGLTHDFMRNRDGAFTRIVDTIADLQDSGIPFGFIHTLTRGSLFSLPEIAEFARSQGAHFLQLHPLEAAGRGTLELRSEVLSQEDLMRAFLITYMLREQYEGALAIHLDLLHRGWIADDPERIYAGNIDNCPDTLADALGVIVIEADGSVVPVSYGFSRRFLIASLYSETLESAWRSYREAGLLHFRRLCRSVWNRVMSDDDLVVFNWHELVCHASQSVPALVRVDRPSPQRKPTIEPCPSG